VSNFVDYAEIEIESGKGGPGSVSFRREKYVPRGGPDGGNGGTGGNVYLFADPNMRTLLDFKYTRFFRADNGKTGQGKLRTGRDGKSVTIPVPVGTVITDASNEEIIVDLSTADQRYLIAPGGRGGMGNAHFTSSTHQTPKFAQPGEPGIVIKIKLELKLLADVGLVGLPNSGKSTFISTISAAKPKTADYPFTTLIPHLGVVRRGESREFVVADIPGIIEGSLEGKGVVHRFLRGIERSAFLILLIDISPFAPEDPAEAVDILFHELEMYRAELPTRVKAIVGTKIDIPDYETNMEALGKAADSRQIQFYAISSVTHKNTDHLLNFLEEELFHARQAE